jgi:hypothetical protein
VAGAVNHATLSVHGSVGSVTVGAFNTSDLFVGYSGPGFGGTFDGTPYTLASFTAKAADSFAASYVVATNIKSVTLATLDTVPAGPLSGFGFRQTTRNGKPFGGVGRLAVTDKTNKLSYITKTGGTQVLKDNFEVQEL